VGLRVGTLFVILITSAIGVFAPILLREIPRLGNSRVSLTILTMVKQFGTGIIIATAFIHVSSSHLPPPKACKANRFPPSFTPTPSSCSPTNASANSATKARRQPL
jgi:hypothetical protein